MQGKETKNSRPTGKAHIEYEKMQEEALTNLSYCQEKKYQTRGMHLT